MYIEYNSKSLINIKIDNNDNFLGDTKLSGLIRWPEDSFEKYDNNSYALHLFSLKKGETYSFEIQTSTKTYNPNDLNIFIFDDEKIKDRIQSVDMDFSTIEKITKNGMECTFDAKSSGYACFEIAYDEGWHVEIDGQEIEKEAIYDVFLGAKIPEGKHSIKIYYIPQGFIAGSIISIISLILLICLVIFYDKKKSNLLLR